MVQQVKVPESKANDLNSVLETHVLEEESRLLQDVF